SLHDVPRIDREADAVFVLCCARSQRIDCMPPSLIAAGDLLPCCGRATQAHQGAGNEDAAAKRRGEIIGGDDLLKIESVGHENELRRKPARGKSLDGGNGRGETRSRADAVMSSG